MPLDALMTRAEQKCELCGATDGLQPYTVPPHDEIGEETAILACATCHAGLADQAATDAHHWHCLRDSMWSAVAPVQVVIWRQLGQLAQAGEGWAQDARDMMYLEPEVQNWAEQSTDSADSTEAHRDSNGAVLEGGDAVTLIKDLPVKGAGFTAKRGTAVRNISLVPDEPGQIEGRVNGQRIIILTKFVKKS
ncbi:MAG: alkylphosphonate utilization protein [Alphaproteobacteria bacterium]